MIEDTIKRIQEKDLLIHRRTHLLALQRNLKNHCEDHVIQAGVNVLGIDQAKAAEALAARQEEKIAAPWFDFVVHVDNLIVEVQDKIDWLSQDRIPRKLYLQAKQAMRAES